MMKTAFLICTLEWSNWPIRLQPFPALANFVQRLATLGRCTWLKVGPSSESNCLPASVVKPKHVRYIFGCQTWPKGGQSVVKCPDYQPKSLSQLWQPHMGLIRQTLGARTKPNLSTISTCHICLIVCLMFYFLCNVCFSFF